MAPGRNSDSCSRTYRLLRRAGSDVPILHGRRSSRYLQRVLPVLTAFTIMISAGRPRIPSGRPATRERTGWRDFASPVVWARRLRQRIALGIRRAPGLGRPGGPARAFLDFGRPWGTCEMPKKTESIRLEAIDSALLPGDSARRLRQIKPTAVPLLQGLRRFQPRLSLLYTRWIGSCQP